MRNKEPLLTREHMDGLTNVGCSDPDCTHDDHTVIYLHSYCHDDAPAWVSYNRDSKVMRLECAECRCTIGEYLLPSVQLLDALRLMN